MADNLNFLEPDAFYGTTDGEADNLEEEPVETVDDTEEGGPEETDEDFESQELEDEESDDSEEFEYVEINGQDVSFDEISEWKQAFEDRKSMQADYTRKTQGISETVKQKVDEAIESELSEVRALKAVLEDMLTGDDKDLDELLEYDTAEYIKEKEKRDKRKEALDKASKLTTKKSVLTEEKAKEVHDELIAQNDSWVKDGNFTKQYEADMGLLKEYVGDNNFTKEEYHNAFNTKVLGAIIKAAKYDELKNKAKATKKQVKAVVKSKAKKAAPKKSDNSFADSFYS